MTAKAATALSPQADLAICPSCGSSRLRRSRRRGIFDVLRSWSGVFPYRCAECQRRCFRKRHDQVHHQHQAPARPDKRPEANRRARQRKLREILFYILSIAAFLAFLYQISREPAP